MVNEQAACAYDEDEGPVTERAPVIKQRRGFAAMDPEKTRAIARMGGKAAHAAGTAHKWDAEAAREAGRKGGLAPHKSRGRSQ